MPRTPRQAPGGIIYHVLNRAVARIHIFKRDQDKNRDGDGFPSANLPPDYP